MENFENENNDSDDLCKSTEKLSIKESSNKHFFENYWSLRDVKRKKLAELKLHINKRNSKIAFLSDLNDPSKEDLMIDGVKDRNRALDGDIVCSIIKKKIYWKILNNCKDNVMDCLKKFESENPQINIFRDENHSINNENHDRKFDILTLSKFVDQKILKDGTFLKLFDDKWFQKTAKVVYIVKRVHRYIAVGTFSKYIEKNHKVVYFNPVDSCLPRLEIPYDKCPEYIISNLELYNDMLCLAKIVGMPITSKDALGEFMYVIGKKGDIEAETNAILIENGVDTEELNENSFKQLPSLSILKEEYSKRVDLRDTLTFTIDSIYSRDIDDALNCRQISEDVFEIGVHISDVSFFVKHDSELDKIAQKRLTSVYLVQKVIPMLPRFLSENLLSLLPNEERLTFSVIWLVKSNGDIIDEWFGRTIIKSVAKLNYENVQNIIENKTEIDLPILRNKFKIENLKQSIINLDKFAKLLRKQRFSKGGLLLHKTKLIFSINQETLEPMSMNIDISKDSNLLVEEFMLLANSAIARHIKKKLSNWSVLKCHSEPIPLKLQKFCDSLKGLGYECDISSSCSIQKFLNELDGNEDEKSKIACITFKNQLIKIMQRSKYICSGAFDDNKILSHYGLGFEFYTHFTSPIRRYPDIIVHRLLAAALDYEKYDFNSTDLQTLCELCNDKIKEAKNCSERNKDLFLAAFINKNGSLIRDAYVIEINDYSFDVLINSLGLTQRVYCNKLEIIHESIEYFKSDTQPELKFTWKPIQSNNSSNHHEAVTQSIKLFSKVHVILSKHEKNSISFMISLQHPNSQIQS